MGSRRVFEMVLFGNLKILGALEFCFLNGVLRFSDVQRVWSTFAAYTVFSSYYFK